MQLQSIITEDNSNPVFILSKLGRIVYANIPGMDIMNYHNLDIGDKIHTKMWIHAKSSFSSGVFMLPVKDSNYKWTLKVLHSGLVYLQAKQAVEANLMFTRV